MIYETKRGNFTIQIADYHTDEFEYISQGAKSENAKEYMNIQLGGKYEYSVVLSYNDMPYTFFMMCNGGRYDSNAIRVFTKLYTIPQFRSNYLEKYLLEGDTITSASNISHSLVANFIEDILPETTIKPYDLYFYSRTPGDTPIVNLLNKFAKTKWQMTDRLYFVGTKDSDVRAWKYLIYKGDIDQFTKPSLSLDEFNYRFYSKS
jgi:hypothetical protein